MHQGALAQTSCLPQVPERFVRHGVALDTDPNAAGTGVTFCFTERTGGVSPAPFSTLNLGFKGGDDPKNVRENRERVFRALEAEDLLDTLAVPNQVHGDEVVVIDRDAVHVREALDAGADAVVCTLPGQAVMLLYADCTPVVLVAPGGFAVIHSGWRGTLAGIAGKTARLLSEACGCACSAIAAYIGPHISGASYEVSAELLETFEGRFGACARWGERRLDLSACVASSLRDVGVEPERIVDCGLCTAQLTDRFFSHRAEHGSTGRHAAVAFMHAAMRGSAPTDGGR